MTQQPERRRVPRAPAVGRASLTAVWCKRLAAGARLDATVADISSLAAGLSVEAPLVEGDRLTLSGRFFGVELNVDVTVASARPSEGGETVVGCHFSDGMTGEQRIAIERVVLARGAQDDLGLGARFAMGA